MDTSSSDLFNFIDVQGGISIIRLKDKLTVGEISLPSTKNSLPVIRIADSAF